LFSCSISSYPARSLTIPSPAVAAPSSCRPQTPRYQIQWVQTPRSISKPSWSSLQVFNVDASYNFRKSCLWNFHLRDHWKVTYKIFIFKPIRRPRYVLYFVDSALRNDSW
jgi:hypothetical protein